MVSTPTQVCILIYKLETLDVIIKNKTDRNYCLAWAKFFNIEKIDSGMYSKIICTIQTSITAENQNKIDFDALSYLKILIIPKLLFNYSILSIELRKSL